MSLRSVRARHVDAARDIVCVVRCVHGAPDVTSLDFVTERLAVGGQIDAVADLTAHGITHVVNCQIERDDKTLPGAEKLAICWIGRDDNGAPWLPAYVESAVRFALYALLGPRAKLYVHCAAGIHRGPSIAYAIVRSFGFTPLDAEALVCARRPVAQLLPAYRDSIDAVIKAW